MPEQKEVKKISLVGKIFMLIGIIILILIIILGLTAYQAYNLVKDVQEKIPAIQENVQGLMAGDCIKLPLVESDINEIKIKVTNACKNPIISLTIQKLEQVPIKCNQLSSLEDEVNANLEQVRNYCNNLAYPTK